MSEIVSLAGVKVEVPKLVYVNKDNGNDSNDGSKNNPVASINKAVKLSPSGGGIIVSEGEYIVNCTNNSDTDDGLFTKGIHFFGSGMDTKFLTKGTSSSGYYSLSGYFYNIWFEKYDTSDDNRILFYIYARENPIRFYNCFFKRTHNTSTWFFFLNSGHPDYKSLIKFKNCTFDMTGLEVQRSVSEIGQVTFDNCAFTGEPDYYSEYNNCLKNANIDLNTGEVLDTILPVGVFHGEYRIVMYKIIFKNENYYTGVYKRKLMHFNNIELFKDYSFINKVEIDKGGVYISNEIFDEFTQTASEDIKSKYNIYAGEIYRGGRGVHMAYNVEEISLEDYSSKLKYNILNIDKTMYFYKKSDGIHMANNLLSLNESDMTPENILDSSISKVNNFIVDPTMDSSGVKYIKFTQALFNYIRKDNIESSSENKFLIRFKNNIYTYANSGLTKIQTLLSPSVLNQRGVDFNSITNLLNSIKSVTMADYTAPIELIFIDNIKFINTQKIVHLGPPFGTTMYFLNLFLKSDTTDVISIPSYYKISDLPITVKNNLSFVNCIILLEDTEEETYEATVTANISSRPIYGITFDGYAYGYKPDKDPQIQKDENYFMTGDEVNTLINSDIFAKMLNMYDPKKGLYETRFGITCGYFPKNDFKNPHVDKIKITYSGNTKIAIMDPVLSLTTTHTDEVNLKATLKDLEGEQVAYRVLIKKQDGPMTPVIEWNLVDNNYKLNTSFNTTEHLGIGENLIKIEARETGGLISNWIGKVTVVNNSPIVSITNTNFSMSANISDPDSDRVTVQVEIDGKVIFPYKTELHEYLNSPTVFNYTWDPKYIHFGRDHIVTLKVKDILGGEKSTSFNIKGEYRTILLLDDRGRLYSNGAGDKIKALSMGRIPIPGESEVYKVNIKNNTNEVINTLIIKPDVSKPENTTPKFSLSNDPYNWVDQLSHSSVINHGDTIPLYIKVEVSNTGTASSVEFPIIIEAAN